MSIFQRFLDEKVKAGVAPGLSAVVFGRDGEIFSGADGVHTSASGTAAAKAVRPETVHWMASCSKISISIIVLQILERGLANGLSLESLDDHDALVSVLPEFKLGSGSLVTQILQGFGPVGADGRRELKLRDSKSKTTLRHLLTHSAGLSYYWTPDVMVEYFKPTQGLAHGNLAFATGKIDDFTTPAVQEAGISMEYSAVADWLGQFAVRSTGKNLRSLLMELILAPLGVSNDECDLLLRRMGDVINVSGMHRRGAKEKQEPPFVNIPFGIYQPESEDPPPGEAYFASAGIYATPRAYSKVLQACLVHDARLLKEETWSLAEADAWKGKIAMPRPLWKSGRPDLTYGIDEYAPSTAKHGGYGINLLQAHVALAPTISGRPTGSYSWAGLGNTFFFVDPANGIGALISTQLLPFADPQMMQLKDEWEALIYSQLP